MPAITIYTAMLCPYCQMAKQLLDQKGLSYQEVDVTGRSDMRAAMREKAGGRSTVPQIFVGAHHVGGCDDLYALERSGGLDKLLQDGRGT